MAIINDLPRGSDKIETGTLSISRFQTNCVTYVKCGKVVIIRLWGTLTSNVSAWGDLELGTLPWKIPSNANYTNLLWNQDRSYSMPLTVSATFSDVTTEYPRLIVSVKNGTGAKSGNWCMGQITIIVDE